MAELGIELVDLSEFNVSFEQCGTWDGCPEILGDKDGQYFKVAYREGYDRSNGLQATGNLFETETFYIEYIEALRAKGLGASALAFSLDFAKSRNFDVARMAVVNPRIISIIEKLVKVQKIHERYYIASDAVEGRVAPEDIRPVPSTEDFRTSSDLILPEKALDILNEDIAREEDDLIAVWAVMYF